MLDSPALPTGPVLHLRGRAWPVVLPSWRDPRLHLAAVVMTIHVLGQVTLGFDESIAQILVSMGTAAAIEFAVVARRRRALVWPASALLTGSSVALLLRVPGTHHGDWWSLRGAWVYAATVVVALASKYRIRRGDVHVFNPSNFGLLACFLVLGPGRVEPLAFWWGPLSPGVIAALVVIGLGGVTLLARLRTLDIAVAFWCTFIAAVGIMAAAGHCMTARWHLGALCGIAFVRVLALSPEVFVFCLLMITDPRTSPQTLAARRRFGVVVAIAAAVLIAPQHSEFATKVALLAALAFACAARPTIERAAHARAAAGRTRRSRGRAFASVVAVVVILVGGARLATAARPDAASERRALSSPDGSAPDVTVVAPHGVDAPIDRPTALVIGHDLAAAVHGPGARLDRVAISVAERPGQEEPAVMATMWGHTDATHALHRSVEVQFRHDRWTIVSDDLPPGFVPPR